MNNKILVDKALAEHVAELARLELPSEEGEALIKDMNDIVRFASRLAEVELAETDTTLSHTRKHSLREDIPENNISREELLRSARTVSDGYITVPKVLEA